MSFSELDTRTLFDIELGSYLPELLTEKYKVFTPELLHAVSHAELELARLDQHLTESPYKTAVRNALVTLETVSTMAVEGQWIDPIDLLKLRVQKNPYDFDLAKKPASVLERAARYQYLVERHYSAEQMKDFVFSKESVFEVYANLTFSEAKDKRYRGSYSKEKESIHQRLPNYRTLAPSKIDSYMEDLYAFANSEWYSPFIQAMTVHFQLSYIRPFKSQNELLYRHISYILQAKRNTNRCIINPVAAVTIGRIDKPIDPYKASPGSAFYNHPYGLWLHHGCMTGHLQTVLIKRLETNLVNLKRSWTEKLKGHRSGDCCVFIADKLMDYPIITAAFAQELSGKTSPAVNEAIRKLVAYNILAPLNKQKRNRYFVATDLVSLYETMIAETLPVGWRPGVKLYCE